MRVGSAITFCILKSSKSLSKFFVLDVIKMEPGLFWASFGDEVAREGVYRLAGTEKAGISPVDVCLLGQ